MITISESGMTFGPFEENHCFKVEKCEAYDRIKDRVKIAEFVWLRDDLAPPTIWIVEAKSSSPRPESPQPFDDFIAEIREKLLNALSMVLSACLKRPESAYTELSVPFRGITLSALDARLILVIHGHQADWLPPLKDALSKALHATVKVWGLAPSAVIVLNDDLARRHNLIK